MEAQVATEATAHGYAEAIRATIRLVDDPVGPTMRRWADALADLGVGEGDLSDGVRAPLRASPGKLHASVMNGAWARESPLLDSP